MKIKTLQTKKALRSVLLVLLLSVIGMANALAQSFTVGNLNYSINYDETSVTVTGHVNGTNATGELVLPESVTYGGITYQVTTIGNNAFNNCSGFTGNLTIPNTITSIGNWAFRNCSGFNGSLIIGNSVISIGTDAFRNCSGFIGDLTIPNSVVTINTMAFDNCSGFTGNLTLGNSITEIGHAVFQSCSGFTGNLVIPNSVTSIKDFAFSGCRGFTGNLIIPNSVTSIKRYAFQSCLGFTGTLTLGNALTTIGDHAFINCSGFTGDLIIPNSLTTISDYAFRNCTSFTGNLLISNSVTVIGKYAFADCYGFTGTIIIPNSVTSIGSYAFAGCYGFSGNLVIPNSVMEIGKEENDQGNPFQGCIGLEQITVELSNMFYDSRENCNAIIETATNTLVSGCSNTIIPNTVTAIGNYAFAGLVNYIGPLNIPNSVTTIGEWAFYNCSSFTGSLTIPNSVTTIGSGAFCNCSGFTGNLSISNSITIINEWTFVGCSGFTGNLIIPNSVTELGIAAFNSCTGFTGMIIPSSVITIGGSAFYHCSGFSAITILATIPPSLESYVFTEMNHDIPLIVPCGSLNAYQSVSGWSEFSNIQADCGSTFTITATTNPFEASTISGAGEYGLGDVCTLTATANEGYTFINWTKDGVVVSTEETYNFIVTGSAAFVANFQLNSYEITTTTNPVEGGIVAGSGTYNHFEACTLIATANGGYTFTNWTNNGEVVSTEETYSFIVTESAAFVANFEISVEGWHEYVDLGLPSGLLWATCNLGANTPEAYGDYFAWGETQLKDYYDWSTYQYCNGIYRTLTKYCNRSNYGYNGFTDTLTVLLPEDDAIAANWGVGWRMPTNEEWQELYDNTTCTWTIQNGVPGRLFFASNGNSLFLPAAGGRWGGGLSETGIGGYYWSSSLFPSIPSNAWSFYFNSGGNDMDYDNRSSGLSVRAVRSVPLYLVTAVANPPEGGTVSGMGSYTVGSTCTLTATANEDYIFNNWTKDGEVVSTEATYSFVVTETASYVANFEFIYDPLIYSINDDSVSVTVTGHVDGASATGSIIIPDTKIIGGVTYTVTAIGNRAFSYCSDLTSLTLGNFVTLIGDYAFFNCTGLTSFNIPNSVLEIGNSAFSETGWYVQQPNGILYLDNWCLGYKGEKPTGTLIFDENTKGIANRAFYYCNGLTGSLTIPNSVITIGESSFIWCKGITGLTLGESVTTIGNNGFRGCTNLASITSLAPIPPSLGNSAFEDVNHFISVTVPCGSLDAYQGVETWGVFYNIQEDCGGPTYEINLIANPIEGGIVEGASSYHAGATCTVLAIANGGYMFTNWTKNGEVVSIVPLYSFTVTEAGDYVANFAVCTPTLQVAAEYYPDTANVYSPYVRVHWDEEFSCDGFSYNFDNNTLPNGWTTIDGGSPSGYGWSLASQKIGTGYGHNGSNDYLISQSYDNQYGGAIHPDNYLVSEQVNITEGSIFSFWACGQDNSYPSEHFGVFVSLGSNDNPDDFQEVQSWTMTALRSRESIETRTIRGGDRTQTIWRYYYVDLSDFVGTGYIAIRHYDCFDQYMLGVDDVVFWNGTPQTINTSYNVYRANCDETDVTLIAENVTENEYIDTDWLNLADGNYKYSVRSYPDENGTAWSNCIEKVNNNPPTPSDLQVYTEYYPDSTNAYSPYVKVYWTGIMAGRYNIYRANCDGTNVTLIAENVVDTLFIDQTWFNQPTSNYKYGVSMVNGWGSRGEIQWNDTPSAIEEIIIDASDFGSPSANNGNPERSSRVSYDNGWLHYDNGNCIKSIGSGLGMFHWGVKFPSETLASYAGNQLKKVAVYVRSGNDGNLNLRVHTGGTTAPGTLVCSMAFDVSGYNNEFVEIMLPEPILITGTENLWITLSQAGNCPAQASPESGEANGRWMSLNGQTWMDMASYGLDGTWMIRACVGNDIYWSNCIDKTHYSIAATANPIEGGTVTGEGMYLQGSTCTLTATATSGYHFANWTENGVVVSTSASYTFTVTRSRNLVANFTTNPQVCAISISANPSYGGTVAGAGNYYYGTRCTVTAFNNSGYAFTSWTENGTVVSINASYTFTVTGGRNLVANFTAVPQVGTIIASANPSYSGTITGAGTYSNGTNCTLTATANNGYFFLNWTESGTVVSTNPSYTFIVTGNRSLVANFTTNLHYYGINAMPNPAEGGTVTGGGIYVEGQICTLRAYNASGYSFINWTKDGVVVSTNANYSFLVTENANYVANFEMNNYRITVTANPPTGGAVTGAGSFYYGMNCTVTATANDGYYFAYWTVNGRVVSTNANYTFTVTNNRNLVANFATNPQIYTISVFANPSYGGTISGAGDYYSGTYCTLTVTANSGYAFTNWTENGTVVSTDPNYTFTVSGDRNLAANFTPVGLISASANPSNAGTITGAGSYRFGTSCTLTATAKSGYLFVNWTENGITVSSDARYTFIVMGNRNLVANFVVNPQVYTISVFSNPSYGGTVTGGGTFLYGENCTVNATPISGYTFVNWTENGTVVSYSTEYVFTVTGNRTLLANFIKATNPQVCTISVSVNPSNGGTALGAGNYYNGTSCILKAIANNGYTFVNWTENGTVVSSNANYTFTVAGNRNLVANFTANLAYYKIIATPNPIAGGTVTGAGNYMEGQSCTLLATANFGYNFVNWTENGAVVSFDADYSFIVTGNRNLVANFTNVAFIGINANPNPIDGGSLTGAGIYIAGQTCTLTATANNDYAFINWTENGTVVSNEASYSFTVTRYRNLVANYAIFGFRFVKPGTWSNAFNWLGHTLPSSEDEAFIDAPCQLNQNATVAALSITEGQTLTVQSDKTLTVTGDLTSTLPSGLVIEDGAQLVHESEGVMATVKRYIVGYDSLVRGRFSVISNPLIADVDPEDTSTHLTSGNYDLYDWLAGSPDSLEWRNYKYEGGRFNLEAGRGYLYANQDDMEPSFSGALRPSDNAFGKAVNHVVGEDFHFNGWNLIGNPFVCNVYLVDENGEPLPYYRMNAKGRDFEAVASGVIVPMEGIFYEASESGMVYFTRTAPVQKGGGLRVNLTSGTSTSSETLDNAIIRFGEGQNLKKFNFCAGGSKLYIPQGGKDYAILCVDNTCDSLELCFSNKQSGDFTLNVKATNTELEYLQLNDHVTGTTVDLLKQPTYTFHATGQEQATRFTLVFKKK